MRPARAAIVLAASAIAGLTAFVPAASDVASAAETVQVRITTAPSSAGIAGDFKYVDLLATNQASTAAGPFDWSVTFDADAAMSAGDLYVEGFVAGAWKPLTEHVDDGDLRVDLGALSAIAPFGSFRGQVRFLLVDGAGRGSGPFVSSLSIAAGVHPVGSIATVASDTTETSVHLLDVGAPEALTATVGIPAVFDVTTHNVTGSNFAALAVVPSTVPDGPRIEWERDGTFVDFDAEGDLPALALREGASSHTRWRITYLDRPATGTAPPVVWTALRLGYDLDAGQRSASGAPDPGGRYFAGRATTAVTVRAGAAQPTSSPSPAASVPVVVGATSTASPSTTTSSAASQGDGNVSVTVSNDEGDDGTDGDAPVGGLARTGIDLILQLVAALLVLALGAVLMSGTRRGPVGRHR